MPELPSDLNRILVVKLGALGDFVQAMGPFQAIRSVLPGAHITLLTTKPFAGLAAASGWFDAVWLDEYPRGPLGFLKMRTRLRDGRFDMVFDLQTSDRSSVYWRLTWPSRPRLSGIAKGASHPHDNPDRDRMHTLDRQRDQLARAGIADVPPPDISWMDGVPIGFELPENFGLLVPGGAPHRLEKRWPAQHYAELAGRWVAKGRTPVLIGANAERTIAATIADACPEALDLTGKTSIVDLAGLARHASVAVGNDTGPMHLAAIAGCRCVVLYSHASDPALCGQQGPDVAILREPALGDLTVESVAAAADPENP